MKKREKIIKGTFGFSANKQEFSKEMLKLAKQELLRQEKRDREAFIIKMETDKKLDWI